MMSCSPLPNFTKGSVLCRLVKFHEPFLKDKKCLSENVKS